MMRRAKTRPSRKNSLGGKSRKRKSFGKQRSNSLDFLALEKRELLAVTLDGGVLNIVGTNSNDSAIVNVTGQSTSNPLLVTNLNGVNTPFPVSAVDRIAFVGLNGNDVFTNNSAFGTNVGKPSNANGGAGNDVLTGSSGNDTFFGGPGNDTFNGKAGNDGYVFTNAAGFEADRILEPANGGNDHLWFGGVSSAVTVNLAVTGINATIASHSGRTLAAGDFTAAANIEYVTGGTSNDSITGNNLPNSFIGGAGNDSLIGGGGNDVLNGGAGSDYLAGGASNDVYVFADATSFENDRIFEGANQGRDRLLFISVTSPVNANLSLSGNNVVIASHLNRNLRTASTTTAANLDYITGGSADDTLTGNNLRNDLFGYNGNDTLTSLGGNDSVRGGNGDDLLIGGDGNNTLNGGNGDDIYRFTNTSGSSTPRIVESASGGMDSLDFRPVTTGATLDPSATNGILVNYSSRSVQMKAGSAEVNVENIFGVNGEDRHIFDGAGQTIAVIDSGIDYHHPLLGGGIGSGFKVVGGYDFVDNDANPDDVHGHGTFVAGIAAGNDSASQPNFKPVATASNLASVRVLDAANRTTAARFIQGLEWVNNNYSSFANDITTVNISIGFENQFGQAFNDTGFVNTDFSALLNSIKSKGIYVAVSAGNSYTSFNTPGVGVPASDVSVFPVASHDSAGNMSTFSQRANRALVALGTNAYSTTNGGGFGSGNGTSFASPFVAGASALVRQAYSAIGVNSASPDQLYQAMFQHADNINDSGAIYKKINLDEALAAVVIDKFNGGGGGLSGPTTPPLNGPPLGGSVSTPTIGYGTGFVSPVELTSSQIQDSFDLRQQEFSADVDWKLAGSNDLAKDDVVGTGVLDSAFADSSSDADNTFDLDESFPIADLVSV